MGLLIGMKIWMCLPLTWRYFHEPMWLLSKEYDLEHRLLSHTCGVRAGYYGAEVFDNSTRVKAVTSMSLLRRGLGIWFNLNLIVLCVFLHHSDWCIVWKESCTVTLRYHWLGLLRLTRLSSVSSIKPVLVTLIYIWLWQEILALLNGLVLVLLPRCHLKSVQ